MGFRENLKAELMYADMPVRELAALSGVKKQTIDSYLREKGYSPSAEAAVKLARALGVTVEHLVTGETEPDGAEEAAGRKAALRQLARTTAALNDATLKTLITIAKALKTSGD